MNCTKKYLILCALAATLLPYIVSAHERRTYDIGGKTYQIVIGSLNEPLIVDDKSGLDLTVTQGGGMPTMGPDGDMDGPPSAGIPIQGLDQTLKLEMSAGNQKKNYDLAPAYGKPGSYKTTFFPTIQTTFTYRLFGTINKVPVDLSFTCNPAGHPQAEEDKNLIKISDTVTQKLKTGAFGCAEAKSDFGFPEAAATTFDLQSQSQTLASKIKTTRILAITGVVITVLGTFLAMRSRKSSNS